MTEKMRLDPETLRVSTFTADEVPTDRGTVRANDEDATNNVCCKTVCFTTPCCAPTVTCP
ncbi:MAG: hypothetical protein JO306_08525 [Gemmatimonadetes bacterium]|nr:hypothetical protein [Gemmatimonadota bacterium]